MDSIPGLRLWRPHLRWLDRLIQSFLAGLVTFTRYSTQGALLSITAPLFGFRHGSSVDKTHVRLIRLPEPDQPFASPPSLILHTFALSDCPPYIALSYTWGPPDPGSPPYSLYDRQTIKINGRSFSVFPSLFQAITQVSAARPGWYIWIDGICINQADPGERAAQVGIMDSIYTGADETVIWLGPETQYTQKAILKIEEMAVGAPERITHWATSQTLGDVFIADDEEQLIRNGFPPMVVEDWLCIADIVTRTWFRRVWIMQEIALSRKPVIFIGKHSLPWETLGNAALLVLGSNAITAVLAIGTGVQMIGLIEGITFASNLQILREWCRGDQSPFRGILHSIDFASGIAGSSAGTILASLVMASKGSRATVRQDKVYGLLGILSYMMKARGLPAPDITVDYVSPSEKVLTNLGFYLFRQTESLHLLSLAGEASHQFPTSIPTWVPSFESVNSPVLSPSYTNLRPFNACNSTPPVFRIDELQLKLHVQAISPTLGSIEELGELWTNYMAGNFLKTITMLLHCGNTYLPTNQPIVEALWRTLIMDSNTTSRPAPAALAASFKSWFLLITITSLLTTYQKTSSIFDLFDSLEPLFTLSNSRDETHLLPTSGEMIHLLASYGLLPDPEVPVLDEADRNSFMERLTREAAPYEGMLRTTLLLARRLVRTVRGYLCLAPFKAEVGDRVMIVQGCPTPLVLRRVQGKPSCFKVVGDVFVHGAMFGEHIAQDAVWRDICLK